MGSLDNLHSGQRSIKFNEWVNPPKRKILRYASKLKLVDQWLAVIKDDIPMVTIYQGVTAPIGAIFDT